MSSHNGKITMRQAWLLYLLFLGSPAITIFPKLVNDVAKQASWIAPIISSFIYIIFLFLLQSFYKKNNSTSLVDIFKDVTGNVFGMILSLFYFIWITIALCTEMRMFAERLTSTILPNSNILVYILSITILIAIVLRSNIETIARMNEIITFLIVVIFITVSLMMIPKSSIENFFPINFQSVPSILLGCLIILSPFSFFIILMFFGDEIVNTQKLKKIGIKIMLFLIVLSFFTIAVPLGLFGTSFMSKMTLPYFVSIREINYFEFIDRIEAVIISLWILTDFIFITVFAYSALHILKKVFSLPSTKSLINIYLLLAIIFCLFLNTNISEFWKLREFIMVPYNIFMGMVIPIIIFIIGKIRKKI